MSILEMIGYLGFTVFFEWIYALALFGVVLFFMVVIPIIRSLLRKERPQIKLPSRGLIVKGFVLMTFFLVAVTIRVYIKERSLWVRDDVSFRAAREYFVCGQVLNGFRSLLSQFIHPEHSLLVPLTAMQRRIYDRGVVLLPENDGEEGVWLDLWFLSHYSRGFHETLDTAKSKYPPGDMIRLTDQCWYAIETCMTKPFSDKRMEEKHFFRDIPRMLFYYAFYQNYSTGGIQGSAKYALVDSVLINRTLQIEAWTDVIRKKWEASDDMKKELQKHPKIEATLDVVQLMELDEIILSKIRTGKFICNDRYASKYAWFVEYVARDHQSALRKILSSTQGKRLYEIAFKPYDVYFVKNYLLHDHCGYSFSLSVLNINKKMPDDLFQADFSDEINMLNKLKYPSQ